MSAFSTSDRIASWTKEVAETRRSCYLRSKTVSKQDLETTSPASKRKRKRSMVDNHNGEAPKKKLGRPPKGSRPATRPLSYKEAAYGDNAPLATPPLEPQPSLLSWRKSSPRKQARYIDQPRAATSIDNPYLRLCYPRLQLKDLRQTKLACSVPQPVLELHDRLQRIELGQIPSELQSTYEKDVNTPRKSRAPPLSPYYLSGQSPYPPPCLYGLKARVDQILEDSAWCHRNQVHERQWGSIVNRLLGEFDTWPIGQGFRLLNIENCPIEPEEMRPILPSGSHLPPPEAQSTSSKTSITDDGSPSVGRMVDWCLALKLEGEDEDLVDKAFSKLEPGEQSLNQSLCYIQRCPLFTEMKIKKTQSNSNPEVQLAIWASAAMLKRKHHDWDLSLPMPGITINGFAWNYYLFFAPTLDDLIMMGPFVLGSTGDLNGVWTIYRRLYILLQWGVSDYRAWFEKEVLQRFRLL